MLIVGITLFFGLYRHFSILLLHKLKAALNRWFFFKVAFWLEMISAFHWRRLKLSIFCSFLIIVLRMNFFIFRIRKTAIYGTWKCSPLFQITISLVLIKVSLKMRHHWNQNTVSYWALPFVLVFGDIKMSNWLIKYYELYGPIENWVEWGVFW